MKSNEQIIDLIKKRKYDSVRYASIDRLTINRIDAQAWTFLGQAMIGLKRGNMAKLCIERAALLDPSATWVNQALNDAISVGDGRDDNQVLKLIEFKPTTVSACILTRNSSRTIQQCIEALQNAVDEIIVVDTGSTDNTIQIVESLGVHVHHFQWIDDFSAARNFAHSLATSDWVISVDSDEILVVEDKQNIRLCASLFNNKNMVLMVNQLNVMNNVIEPFSTGRMYQKSTGVHWVYPIHEYLETQEGYRNQRLKTHPVNIRLFHDGYDFNAVAQEEKLHRNISIIESVLHKEPDNALFLFYLGRELFRLGDYSRSLQIVEKASKFVDPNLEIAPEIPRLLKAIHCAI